MDTAVADWRRRQRVSLLTMRRTISTEERQRATQSIAHRLNDLMIEKGCEILGLYWPIKLEISLLPWIESLPGKVTLCLPVVVTPKAPLEYWRWRQGDKLSRGIWDIPIPAARDTLTPDMVLAPLVGFDLDNYRLGYGGGYFDRTLAALPRRPFAIGVGLEFSVLDTIFPQSHDIPMDVVLTEHRTAIRGDRSKYET